jgi:death on curing protein
LLDGDKRFARYLTLAFLQFNGYRVVMTNDAAYDIVLAVAQGQVELDEIASTFSAQLVPVS